jgi:hypothetical protein
MAAEVESGNRTLKTRRKWRAKREEERSSLKEWSWFVAIWGKKPAPAAPSGILAHFAVKPFTPPADDDNSEDEADDDTVDKWWAVWEPTEVRKLVTWITIKYGVDDEVSSASSSIISTSSGSASPPGGGGEHGIEMSSHPSKLELLALVQNLSEYATSLEFRVQDKNAAVDIGDLDKGKAKAT